MSFIRSLKYVSINVEAYRNYYFCLSPVVYKMSFFFNNLFRLIQKHTLWTKNARLSRNSKKKVIIALLICYFLVFKMKLQNSN